MSKHFSEESFGNWNNFELPNKKDTIVKELINITKVNLDKITPKVFYNINEEYFLKKEQKEKDEFAINFAKYLIDESVSKSLLKEMLEIYKEKNK